MTVTHVVFDVPPMIILQFFLNICYQPLLFRGQSILLGQPVRNITKTQSNKNWLPQMYMYFSLVLHTDEGMVWSGYGVLEDVNLFVGLHNLLI